MNNDTSYTKDSKWEDKENEDLEHLTKDLIQVFSPDNINESSIVQKENLLKRVLKLGGEEYSFEDLRRDIMSIELEDSKQRLKSNVISEEMNTKFISSIAEDQPNISDRILLELEAKERNMIENEQDKDANINNHEQLDICMNQ